MLYPLQKNPSLCWNEWTLVWLSWVHYRMKSDPTFPQFNNMFSFFTLHFLRWVLRFWYSAFRALAAAVCKKRNIVTLVCLITAVCVFGQLEKWWKLEPCFTLSAESRSCFVWRPKAMSQTLVSSSISLFLKSTALWPSIDSAHHFCSPPAETQTWSWDGDSEQRGGTLLFPLKRLKRKFADV